MRTVSLQSSSLRCPAAAAAAALALALSACQAPAIVGSANHPDRLNPGGATSARAATGEMSAGPATIGATEIATQAAADGGAAEKASVTSPVNQRTLDREAAWIDAIRGLDFESGVVVVDPVFVTDDPAQMDRFMGEGVAARDSNLRTESVKAYARAVLAAPHRTEPYMGLGEAMLMKGKTDLAIATYRTVVNMDPSHVEARVGLAESLARVQRRGEAIEEMNTAIALAPDHGAAHARLAIWNYYEGDYAAAWRHVRAARAVGGPLPPQLIPLLEAKMADPGAAARR